MKRIMELKKLQKRIRKYPLERTIYLRQKNKFKSKRVQSAIEYEYAPTSASSLPENLFESGKKTERKSWRIAEHDEEYAGSILV